MKPSANLLWLGAAVSLSAFVAACAVAMFVADRLTDCTTPAVLPVAYFIMLGYAVMAFTGYEPFSSHERSKVPPDARRGPGGVLLWHSGIHGGK